MTEHDERHLRRAIELAQQSRQNGNHPFGALLVDADGEVVLEAENTVLTEDDCTNHAELNLVRAASRRFEEAALGGCTLYTSTEPCGMCAGAIYWSGIGRVVYALGSDGLARVIDHSDASELTLPCREVLGRGRRTVDVSGPHLVPEASVVHEGFWG